MCMDGDEGVGTPVSWFNDTWVEIPRVLRISNGGVVKNYQTITI